MAQERRHSSGICDEQAVVNLAMLASSVIGFSIELRRSDFGQNAGKGLALLERLAGCYIRKALLIDLQWSPGLLGCSLTVDSFIRQHRLNRDHRQLIETFLVRLEEADQILTCVDQAKGKRRNNTVREWKVAAEIAPETKAAILAEIKALLTTMALDHPQLQVETGFLSRVGNQLHDCLCGRVSGLGLLFPPPDSPSFRFGATTFHEHSLQLKHTKVEYMAHAMQEIVLAQNNNVMLRVLEVGAGSGGTTLPVLEHLLNCTSMPLKLEYTFTDISNFFVSKAKPRFESLFPCVQFQFGLLDIETDPVGQGYAAGVYDMVIACDVFHTTRCLGDTLDHTRRLLRPNGVLMLGETFHSTRFLECTFGLTEGWWRFTDERRGSPLISADSWQSLLKVHGFKKSFVVERVEGYGVVFAQAED